MNPINATVNTEVLNPSRIPIQNRPGQNKNTMAATITLGRRAAARLHGFVSAEKEQRRPAPRRLRPASHPLADGKRYGLTYPEVLKGYREGVARARALVDEAERRAEVKRLSRPKA